jgi:hypothetical protein
MDIKISSENGILDDYSQVVDDYSHFLAHLHDGFAARAANAVLFTTDADDLMSTFLAALPEDERQQYTCHACRRFVNDFGRLVIVDANGERSAAMWSPEGAPPLFRAPIAALQKRVLAARITGLFVGDSNTWGQPVTGRWRHMYVSAPARLVRRPTALLSNSQYMAAKLEEYSLLQRSLAEIPAAPAYEAHRLLTSDRLFRSEKCIGIAKWFDDLHQRRAATKDARKRDAIVWYAVATAPPGFAHVKNTMIGTLIEDIIAEVPFDEMKRKFDAKMNPLQYQRPQALPAAGNLDQAEKLVGALGVARSLARRYARMDDIEAIWKPAELATEARDGSSGSVFGHLKPKNAQAGLTTATLPETTLTWEKFRRTVLPDAAKIEMLVPYNATSFFAFVTAADLDAPPILQWDTEARRNPVNWYVYSGGSMASQWRLVPGTYVPVNAISTQPSGWNPDLPGDHHGDGAYFTLQGARDSHNLTSALFPEVLKTEFREIRSSIEAYSRSRVLGGAEEADACGLCFQKSNKSWPTATIRVTDRRGGRALYRLDRWD